MKPVFHTVRNAIPPIHPEGHRFILIFAALSLFAGFFSISLFWIGAGLTLWCALFFRDPVRITPLKEDHVFAPADGTISFVGHKRPPPELGLGDAAMPCVNIFMDVFNVHINRAPVNAPIRTIVYKEGAFLSADLDKASEKNERNSFVFETRHGPLVAVQIAGLVARRIVCWVREGDHVQAGQRLGMIRFGSRVDIYLPQESTIQVFEGQKTIAGETTLAVLGIRDEQTVLTRMS
jgi:phosphatidylserine decarboxylase